MLVLNLNNVEEIIFRNKRLQAKLPELRGYFDQWHLAVRHPFLKAMGKQAVIDLLNALNDKHAELLQLHFGMPVTIDKLNNRVVRNYEFSIDEAEQELNQLSDTAQACAYRKGEQLYISFVR
jgi:hypothetical protein